MVALSSIRVQKVCNTLVYYVVRRIHARLKSLFDKTDWCLERLYKTYADASAVLKVLCGVQGCSVPMRVVSSYSAH